VSELSSAGVLGVDAAETGDRPREGVVALVRERVWVLTV